MRLWIIFFVSGLTLLPAAAVTDSELEAAGRRVWENECGGTLEGLTSWNAGENFASLGIGHFIWYPKGKRGPFEESFPKLLRFLQARGITLPQGLSAEAPCPWATRAEFQAALHSKQTTELRAFLARTVPEQSRFLAQRMEEALPKMLEAAPGSKRENIRRQFNRLSATGAGTFALIDYVNFKGEGSKPEERYHGAGWGLLQVLSGMHGTGPGAPREFAASAASVLTRRVQNAPPERHEERWLAGWKSRVRAYAE
jgi:hypothetical protein